ncbi:MAG TPA: ABC transporter substrate-binding protein [Chloroflexota bacterium]
MPDLKLKTAIGNYGHARALKDGTLHPRDIELEHIEVEPIISAFRRMVRTLEFQVSEMAITTYLCARDHGKPFTAIPVFVLRNFAHSGMTYNVRSGIQQPKDLEGKRMGVRAYTVTSGAWARGILASEYGVDLSKITWVIFDEEHVLEYKAPSNVTKAAPGKNMADMLASGELDAAIGAGEVKSDDVKPLITDTATAEADWFRRTGIWPINHTLVIQNSVLSEHPWVAESLFVGFRQAKELYFKQTEKDGADPRLARLQQLVGPDPYPYGVETNRPTLEAIIKFAYDQHVLSQAPKVEDIFVPGAMSF